MFRKILVMLLIAAGGIVIWSNSFFIGFPIGAELFILASLLDSLRTVENNK